MASALYSSKIPTPAALAIDSNAGNQDEDLRAGHTRACIMHKLKLSDWDLLLVFRQFRQLRIDIRQSSR